MTRGSEPAVARPAPTLLDALIGPEYAAEFLSGRARALAAASRIPVAAAEASVRRAITAGDPHVLASPGQTWSLRDEVPTEDVVAGQLTVLRRPSDREVVVEDNCRYAHTALDLGVLSDYVLMQWIWLPHGSTHRPPGTRGDRDR